MLDIMSLDLAFIGYDICSLQFVVVNQTLQLEWIANYKHIKYLSIHNFGPIPEIVFHQISFSYMSFNQTPFMPSTYIIKTFSQTRELTGHELFKKALKFFRCLYVIVTYKQLCILI